MIPYYANIPEQSTSQQPTGSERESRGVVGQLSLPEHTKQSHSQDLTKLTQHHTQDGKLAKYPEVWVETYQPRICA